MKKLILTFMIGISLLGAILVCRCPNNYQKVAACASSTIAPPSPMLTVPAPVQVQPQVIQISKSVAATEKTNTIISKIIKNKSIKVSSKKSQDTPINVTHPDHFYSQVWCQVAITLGQPLASTPNTLVITDKVPKALAYSVSLKGEPADQFEIRQGEQVISAPNEIIPSSSVYFDVKPLSHGKKKLIYQVKARLSLSDPGIGLPEVQRDIIVEVNNQTRIVDLKRFSTYLATVLGACLTTILGIYIKKWLDDK